MSWAAKELRNTCNFKKKNSFNRMWNNKVANRKICIYLSIWWPETVIVKFVCKSMFYLHIQTVFFFLNFGVQWCITTKLMTWIGKSYSGSWHTVRKRFMWGCRSHKFYNIASRSTAEGAGICFPWWRMSDWNSVVNKIPDGKFCTFLGNLAASRAVSL